MKLFQSNQPCLDFLQRHGSPKEVALQMAYFNGTPSHSWDVKSQIFKTLIFQVVLLLSQVPIEPSSDKWENFSQPFLQMFSFLHIFLETHGIWILTDYFSFLSPSSLTSLGTQTTLEFACCSHTMVKTEWRILICQWERTESSTGQGQQNTLGKLLCGWNFCFPKHESCVAWNKTYFPSNA